MNHNKIMKYLTILLIGFLFLETQNSFAMDYPGVTNELRNRRRNYQPIMDENCDDSRNDCVIVISSDIKEHHDSEETEEYDNSESDYIDYSLEPDNQEAILGEIFPHIVPYLGYEDLVSFATTNKLCYQSILNNLISDIVINMESIDSSEDSPYNFNEIQGEEIRQHHINNLKKIRLLVGSLKGSYEFIQLEPGSQLEINLHDILKYVKTAGNYLNNCKDSLDSDYEKGHIVHYTLTPDNKEPVLAEIFPHIVPYLDYKDLTSFTKTSTIFQKHFHKTCFLNIINNLFLDLSKIEIHRMSDNPTKDQLEFEKKKIPQHVNNLKKMVSLLNFLKCNSQYIRYNEWMDYFYRIFPNKTLEIYLTYLSDNLRYSPTFIKENGNKYLKQIMELQRGSQDIVQPQNDSISLKDKVYAVTNEMNAVYTSINYDVQFKRTVSNVLSIAHLILSVLDIDAYFFEGYYSGFTCASLFRLNLIMPLYMLYKFILFLIS